MKKIMVELLFDEDFIPPEGRDAPCQENDWDCKCQWYCPFHTWDDEFGGGCSYRGPDVGEGCPLKKHFIKEVQ